MKKLRVTGPVGWAVMMVMVGGGAAARASTDLIRPGQSVGPVRLGMSEPDLLKTLGPGHQPALDGYPARHYPAKGLEVLLSPDDARHVVCIAAGGPDARARRFTARTPEGIGIGSTMDDLVTAWGPPDTNRPIALPDTPAAEVTYAERGISLILTHDRVNWLAVRAPAP